MGGTPLAILEVLASRHVSATHCTRIILVIGKLLGIKHLASVCCRIHLSICSLAAGNVYPHKYILVNKSWVSTWSFQLFYYIFKTDICFNIHELIGCVLQWWHMDASGGVAGDGGVRLHFLWPQAQLIDRCRVCPCGWGEWDIWVILFIRVCGVNRDGRCSVKPILSKSGYFSKNLKDPDFSRSLLELYTHHWDGFEEFNLYTNF